jgi:hypothetical protein
LRLRCERNVGDRLEKLDEEDRSLVVGHLHCLMSALPLKKQPRHPTNAPLSPGTCAVRH